MKNILLIIVTLMLLATVSKADDFTEAMMKAKKNLQTAMNTSDEKAMMKVRGEFERILQLKKQEWIVNYYIALVDYSFATTAMNEAEGSNKDKLKKYNQSALTYIEKSILLRDDFADAYVLKYALNFNRWVYEQDKMADIMTQTTEAKEKAEKYEPTNPRFFLMDGIGTYYMPEAFGGGYKKAIPILEKSLEYFGTRVEKEEYYPDWGKDMTYGFLILAYTKRDDEGDKAKVKELFEKGIKEFPDSSFLNKYIKKQLEETK